MVYKHQSAYLHNSIIDKPNPDFENDYVEDVDEVTAVVEDEPVVHVLFCLVGEDPSEGDNPRVVHVGDDHDEQPYHIHLTCKTTAHGESYRRGNENNSTDREL